MKKWIIPVGIIVVLIVIIGFWVISSYNWTCELKADARKSWGNVESRLPKK